MWHRAVWFTVMPWCVTAWKCGWPQWDADCANQKVELGSFSVTTVVGRRFSIKQMGNAVFSPQHRMWCEASLTHNPPGSDGRGKGCHWSCSVLDGTERRPRWCWRRQRAPACLPGPRWVRPACVCVAHIQSGSSLGSPHLRDRDHRCDVNQRLAGLTDTLHLLCIYQYWKTLLNDGWIPWRMTCIELLSYIHCRYFLNFPNVLFKHCIVNETHRVWEDVDEWKGSAGRGTEVEPSSVSNLLASQRCFCTGTRRILQKGHDTE